MAKNLFLFTISKSIDGEWTLDGKLLPHICAHWISEPYRGLRIIFGAFSVIIGRHIENTSDKGDKDNG